MSWQDHRHAPALGAVLCPMDAVPDGGCKELRYGSGTGHDAAADNSALSLLLYRQGNQIRAYVNCCPHFSVPLNARPNDFMLLSEQRVMCAWHCSVFRLQDGHCIDGPAQGMGLETVPIHIDGDRVVLGATSTASTASAACP